MHEVHSQNLSVCGDCRRHATRTEQQHNFDLHGPGRLKIPGQWYRKNQDKQVGDHGEGDVSIEELRLVAAGAVHARVPVRTDGVADEDLDHLNGEVGHKQEGHEDVYSARNPLAHGEDAGYDEEECDFRKVGRWAVDDRAGV